MHYLAGAVLVLELGLCFVLEKVVSFRALDWLGWIVWTLGMAVMLLAISTLRRRGRVPPGSSFVETQSIVTDGIFGVVRHPLYLGWSLMYLVPVLFNLRWELAILGLVGAATVQVFTRQEEKALMARFGDAYRCYAALVPGMDLLGGMLRALRRRRKM